ncbi:hypothetical protein [Amycolatopsis regifaucium]|uniref:Uncharacterized protein n=1 Tax=Amycolatopsis regifaucium TaxID=546365 RepID=A0A154MP90_9PSEU|nr:hypothetical protein [Amycolatopsis regifaucium]KZB86128.1 hypothetical protein AVL48_28505 [Amycolatopsis regifaucium]OKA05018.1 hypothetical protein ATP06_0228585 [Amycolatopsis regifaucium]
MKFACLAILPIAAAPLFLPATARAGDGWESIGTGMTAGASGIAVLSRDDDRVDALVLRDNKKPGENRAARVRLFDGRVSKVDRIDWPGELPVDLEATEAIPGKAGEFIALASGGKGFHIKLNDRRLKVLGTFQVPMGYADDNYESFALKKVDDRLFAVWADRGQDARPATLYSAEFSVPRLSFGKPKAIPFRVSYPTTDVRHASDVEITADNRVLIAAASDPGDTGPFDSAVYAAGSLRSDGSIALSPTPVKIGDFPGHKIEAMTCLSRSCDSLLYGTDDEAAGGSVRIVTGNEPEDQ